MTKVKENFILADLVKKNLSNEYSLYETDKKDGDIYQVQDNIISRIGSKYGGGYSLSENDDNNDICYYKTLEGRKLTKSVLSGYAIAGIIFNKNILKNADEDAENYDLISVSEYPAISFRCLSRFFFRQP